MNRGRESGQEDGREIEKNTCLFMMLLQTKRGFSRGDRRPASSPSLSRDRTQREAVASPGSQSRWWVNGLQQTVPPLKPPA